MSDTITVTGLVATIPKHLVTGAGLAVTTFRLASTQRRFDRGEQKWVDADTNWYTITTFRQLAANVAMSLQKGQRIVVTGRLRVRDWETDGRTGRSVEIDAEALGHDLTWGTAAFTRSAAATVAEAETSAATGPDEPEEGVEATPAEGPTEGAATGAEREAESEHVPAPF